MCHAEQLPWRQTQTLITVQWLLCSSSTHSACSLDIYEGIISAQKGRKKRERDNIDAGGGTKAACDFDWLPRVELKQESGRIWAGAKGNSEGRVKCLEEVRGSWRDWGLGQNPKNEVTQSYPQTGKIMWDLPCLFCQHPTAWISSIKHLNFPCHNLFLHPDFQAAGWQKEEFTSRFKAAPGRNAGSAFYAWKTRFSCLNRWYWFNSDYCSMVIWAFKKYFQMPTRLLGPNYVVHGPYELT